MDNNQRVLVELLSLSIRGKRASEEELVSVDWDAVLHLAQDHSVLPLVYTSLSSSSIDKYDLSKLKTITCRYTVQQVQNLEVLRHVIVEFEKADIPLLAMKGLALKNLYPIVETRTMCDFDLAVREENFDAAVLLLLKLGFRETGVARTVHAEMMYGDNLIIELHRKPFAGERFNLSIKYLDSIWNNAVPLLICDKKTLTFSDHDTILNLFLHLANHFEIGGFGLRQLCDIVLFIEAKQENIDWKKFYQDIELLHITRFVILIITICNQLFDMVIPEIFTTKLIQDERIELFIQDIIEGGVYGKTSMVRSASGSVIKKVGLMRNTGLGIFKAVLSFLFPSSKKLYIHYPYINRFPFLLPIAWFHRWIFNLFFKERREIMKVFLKKDTAMESFKFIESHSELVNWILEEEH